jgi:SAM-dependent methyltransferase
LTLRENVMVALDKDAFAGSVPETYERYTVPLIFVPFADDLAHRVARHKPEKVLETAAGTGIVTRHLGKLLPPSTTIVATDLNPAMLEQAKRQNSYPNVQWQQADACALPFADESFDVVVCQFGAMFFPDKAKAFAEAHRVLKPGGHFLFNVWGDIANNDFAEVATAALADMFPNDPPRFLARIPHAYCDAATIARDLNAGGFAGLPEHYTVKASSRAASAQDAATAFCQGTPLRGEIDARDGAHLQQVTDTVAAALGRRFGNGPIEGRMQAHVFECKREAKPSV